MEIDRKRPGPIHTGQTAGPHLSGDRPSAFRPTRIPAYLRLHSFLLPRVGSTGPWFGIFSSFT